MKIKWEVHNSTTKLAVIYGRKCWSPTLVDEEKLAVIQTVMECAKSLIAIYEMKKYDSTQIYQMWYGPSAMASLAGLAILPVGEKIIELSSLKTRFKKILLLLA